MKLRISCAFIFFLVLSAWAQASVKSRFAYVANSASNTVSIYTVDVKTGRLRNNGYVLAGLGPASVTVAPSGKFAYVANSRSNSISAFKINATTGDLTPVKGSPFATGDSPGSVIVAASGKFAYVANGTSNNISAYTINDSTGSLTMVKGSPFAAGLAPTPMAIDPSGKFLYVGNENDSPGGDVSGFTIDESTGGLRSIDGSPFLPGSGAFTLAFVPSGKFGYVTALGSPITAFTINTKTGVPTVIGGSPFNVPAGNSMAIAPSGKFMYLAAAGNQLEVVSVDTTTGALTAIQGGDTGSNPSSVTVDPSGTLVYITNQGPSTGGNPYGNDVWILTLGSNGLPITREIASTQQAPASLALAGGTSSVTYTPKFAYVANDDGDNVSGYKIDASTGALSSVPGSPFKTGAPSGSNTNPTAVAVDPAGKFVYVADFNSRGTYKGYVSAYKINSSTGALDPVAGSPFPAGDRPISVAVDPSDRFVYVANYVSNTISGYSLDSSTGKLTALSGSPYDTAGMLPTSVTVDPSGQFLLVLSAGSDQIEAFSISRKSGKLTSIGSASTGSGPSQVAVDASGQFVYVANVGGGVSAYLLLPGSLFLYQNPDSPFADSGLPFSLATDPTGDFVYVANYGDDDVSAFSIDPGNGYLNALTGSPFAAGKEPQSITVDPSGNFVYAVNFEDNTLSAYKLNQSSGALKEVSASPFKAGSGPVAIAIAGTIH